MASELWIIMIIGIGTYLFRAVSLLLGSRLQWSKRTKEWLSYVSPAVLGALLGPLLLLQDDQLVSLTENKVLLASIPTIIVAWSTRRLLLTVTAGVIFYAAIYYLL
ncbi:branched-subunit amino acid transport protein [Fontibacillus solani]|uniref:Branched-subunit amino acid transport protein n=1 Tax=Fontibacillus solani TaxID=1572857 RepID=A0A7W3ST73_9BACL|nr:AzlD domain-containing protein [Fontibacillus solani]MBA9085812.1 branched-subunit amino acid transport protein [Fontibacillus solani]